MAWIRVPLSDESIREGQLSTVIVNEKPIMFCRIKGSLRAFDAICTHKAAYLPLGIINDSCIECPMHNAQYDLDTGKSLKGPHHLQGVVIPVPDLKSYEIRSDAEGLMVDA